MRANDVLVVTRPAYAAIVGVSSRATEEDQRVAGQKTQHSRPLQHAESLGAILYGRIRRQAGGETR